MAKILNLQQHAKSVQRRFPATAFKYVVARGVPALQFRLHLQPTSTSDTYEVFFCVWAGSRPWVFVVAPRPIKEFNGVPTPHLMSDSTLCLYDMVNREWHPGEPVAIMIPWVERWLVHYEHWEVYGEWLGDEALQPTKKSVEELAA